MMITILKCVFLFLYILIHLFKDCTCLGFGYSVREAFPPSCWEILEIIIFPLLILLCFLAYDLFLKSVLHFQNESFIDSPKLIF